MFRGSRVQVFRGSRLEGSEVEKDQGFRGMRMGMGNRRILKDVNGCYMMLNDVDGC